MTAKDIPERNKHVCFSFELGQFLYSTHYNVFTLEMRDNEVVVFEMRYFLSTYGRGQDS